MRKIFKVFFACVVVFALVSVAFSATKPLSAKKQREVCVSILKQVDELDRKATMAGRKLEETVNKKAPQGEIVSAATEAMNTAKEVSEAFGRIQLDLPDGLKSTTEEALNEVAYEMKMAYSLTSHVYKNFIDDVEEDENAKIDRRNQYEISQHMLSAIEAKKVAKKSVGIKN